MDNMRPKVGRNKTLPQANTPTIHPKIPVKATARTRVKASIKTPARTPSGILMICPSYNERWLMPYKLDWCKANCIPLYVLDNYSTDGTWEYLMERWTKHDAVLAGLHQVDTKGAFDLRILQRHAVNIAHAKTPEWVIWSSIDLFYETNMPFNQYLQGMAKKGYNAVSATVVNLNNTGENCANCNPFETYFYCTIGKPVTMAVMYSAGLKMNGDTINIPKMNPVQMPGALFNMGFTKSREDREETLKRRQLAWKRGMRKQQGRHYPKAQAHGWVWEKDTKNDIRKKDLYRYYQKLQKDTMPPSYANAKYYDDVFRMTVGTKNGTNSTVEHLKILAKYCKGGVLDLGCGLGLLADMIGNEVYLGVDQSDYAVNYAREHVKNPLAQFMVTDLRWFIENHYGRIDTIVLSEVLEHITFPKELARFAMEHADRIVGSVPTTLRSKGHIKPTWSAEDIMALFGKSPKILEQGCKNSKKRNIHWHFVFETGGE